MINYKDLSGVFGMLEMEVAAAYIYNLSGRKVNVGNIDDSIVRVGIAELLYYGWLDKVPPYYNGIFTLGGRAIKRIEGKLKS